MPSQVFGEHMADRGEGVILNIASMNAFRPLTNIAAYSAAKAAIANFTQWLSTYMCQRHGDKMRVNAIAPAFIATWRDQSTYDTVARFVPVGHVGKPEDVALLVVYLCSDASRYVHGQVFCLDGGSSAGGYAPTGYVPTITEGQ